MLHLRVPRTTFPARQTIAQSAFGSNNCSVTEQSPTMRPGGVRLAAINESNGSGRTTETNSSGEFYFLLFYPSPARSRVRWQPPRVKARNGSRFSNVGSHPLSVDLTSKIEAAKRYRPGFLPPAGTVSGFSSVVFKRDDAAEPNFVLAANGNVDELILVVTGVQEEVQV